MPKQSHPAQRARFAAGLAGATGFVAMVPVIADGSMQPTQVALAAVVDEARANPAPQLDLQGSALAGAAANTSGDPSQAAESLPPATETTAQAESAVEPAETTTPSAGATSTTASPTTASPTTPPPTAAPPTTLPPTTDTTSSAS